MLNPKSEIYDPYNLLSPDIFDDPYSTYHFLRYEDPVHWSDLLDSWILTGYSDINSLLRDPRISSAKRRPAATAKLPKEVQEKMMPIDNFLSMWILNMDPPDHTQLRILLNKSFTVSAIENIRPRIQAIVDELINAAKESKEFDLINDFAYPLPVRVIAEIIGIPADDNKLLMKWFQEMSIYFQVGPAKMRVLESMERTISEMKDYLHTVVAARRLNPKKDAISNLLMLEKDNKLNLDQLVSTCVLLLFSGHESTRSLIGNGVLALLSNPDQMQKLRNDPSLIESAVEEFLRYDGPFMRQDRVAIADIKISDRHIKNGQHIILVLGAANRDPKQFEYPDWLDICRRDNKHVAFGHGNHFCLGARLARCETQIAINSILKNFPGLELASNKIQWREHFNHRGLKILPVSY